MLLPTDIVVPINIEIFDVIRREILLSSNKNEYDQKRYIIKNYSFSKDYRFSFSSLGINKVTFDNCYFEHASFKHSILSDVSFNNCEIKDSSFSNSNLKCVSFYKCDISNSNFKNCRSSYSLIRNTEAVNVNFGESKLKEFDFFETNLWCSNFSKSYLTDVRFTSVNLTNSKFIETVFYNSIFNSVNLRYTNLSKSKGLLNPIDYLQKNFEWEDVLGINRFDLIVYKLFNSEPPDIHPGYEMNEEVNYDRTLTKASGITVYNKCGIKHEISKYILKHIWKCRIQPYWLSGIVVPYDPGAGTIRAAKIKLMKKIDSSFFYE